MPRPQRCRKIGRRPDVTYFKPAGMGLKALEEIVLTIDEYEAVRLKDLNGLDQAESASKMNISQPTFQRLITIARKKISDAIINGKAIKVEGGNIRYE